MSVAEIKLSLFREIDLLPLEVLIQFKSALDKITARMQKAEAIKSKRQLKSLEIRDVITVQVPEGLVEIIGLQQLEKLLNEMLDSFELRLAAYSLLNDLKREDLMLDPNLKATKEAAWTQEKDSLLQKMKKQIDEAEV